MKITPEILDSIINIRVQNKCFRAICDEKATNYYLCYFKYKDNSITYIGVYPYCNSCGDEWVNNSRIESYYFIKLSEKEIFYLLCK